MRPALFSAITALAVTAAAAQTSTPRIPVPLPNPGAAAPGVRQPDGAAMPPHQAGASSPDQTFLARAARCGHAQVELARLAEQRGSPSVREFARQMIVDHEQANRALQALAESEGAPAPDQMDAEQRQIREALGRLSGAEFDIEYLRLAVQLHQRTATLMEYVIGSGADPQVRRAASDGLPRVFTHLVIARQLLDQASMQSPQIAGAPPRKVTGMPTPQTPRASGN